MWAMTRVAGRELLKGFTGGEGANNVAQLLKYMSIVMYYHCTRSHLYCIIVICMPSFANSHDMVQILYTILCASYFHIYMCEYATQELIKLTLLR